MILNTQAERRIKSADDSLIPLINVVFLMLIFFMVAGHIEVSDGAEVAPPVSLSENKLLAEYLKVVVTKEGQVFIDGVLIEENQLTQRIFDYSHSLDEDEKSAIIVKADAELEVEQLQVILKQIKAAGIERLSLITSQDQA